MSVERSRPNPNWSAPSGSEKRDPIAEGREVGGLLPDPAPVEHDREDDRRGEHNYPDEDVQNLRRPSQKERDRLKARLTNGR